MFVMKITYSPINYIYTYNNYKRNNVPTFKANPANISKETLAKFIEKDYSIKQIADELGIDRYHVYTYLKKNNLQTSAMKEYEELKDNIVYHLERGETMSEIKAQYDYMDKDKIKQAIQTVLNKKDELEIKEIGKKNRKERIEKIKESMIKSNQDTIPSGYMKLKPAERIELLTDVEREKLKLMPDFNQEEFEEMIQQLKTPVKGERKKLQLFKEFHLIKSYISKGYNLLDIGKVLKMPTAKIRGIFHSFGYEKRYIRDRDVARTKLAFQYRETGMSDEEIAQKFSITLKTLQRVIRKYEQNV